jgi:galactose oxidase
MQIFRKTVQWFIPCIALLVLGFWANPAIAQVEEVAVGITPSCPYGLEACWAGAYDALSRLEGVESVSKRPDAYNCTAKLRIKSNSLPDPEKWAGQLKQLVDEAYGFRGVEVSVCGTLESHDGSLAIRVPGVERPITLVPFQHKLQWNSKKDSPRQPEPDERDAHKELATRAKDAKDSPLKIRVTGPLTKSQDGYQLEVREVTVQRIAAKDGPQK